MSGKLSNAASKLIKSLQQKKFRDLHGLFVIEGVKMIEEALNAEIPLDLVALSGNEEDFPFQVPEGHYYLIPKELEVISGMKTPNKILATVKKFAPNCPLDFNLPIMALDGISDPGNLGTIIRLCDWFGFNQLVCDVRSVDLYNPKVVQASMGSLFRVNVVYDDLSHFLSHLPEGKKVQGAYMDGDSIYDVSFSQAPIVVLGSESHGIADNLTDLIHQKVTIPRVGGGESLNIAVSAAIIAAEISRHRA